MRTNNILVIEDQEALWEAILECLTSVCDIAPERITRVRSRGAAALLLVNTDRDDPEAFHALVEPIGYGLMNLIERAQPDAVVVGTSSLQNFDRFQVPTLVLDKTRIFDELPPLVGKAW